MADVKVYINDQNQATFVCPECQKAKSADVGMYTNIKTAVRVKCRCKCGHSYSALLERRKFYRKKTNLPGKFVAENGIRGVVTVKDVSQSGLGLELSAIPDIKVGDKLTVEFNLDDLPRSEIKREVIVRSIKGNNIGAEFTSLEHYDRLGPYLI